VLNTRKFFSWQLVLNPDNLKQAGIITIQQNAQFVE